MNDQTKSMPPSKLVSITALPDVAKLPVHKLAELFPEADTSEFAGLVASVKRDGILQPITLFDDEGVRAFSEQFGMEPLIAKKVAVFSDARLDGVPQRNLSNIVERILLIVGQDDVQINRKHSKYWEGFLCARLIVFSNELLKLPDASGALPGRFITFRMVQSFFGREDVNLTNKLLAERSGIFNLALDAFDRLCARGRLIQPASGLEMSESLGELCSDIAVFVEERCVVGTQHQIQVEMLFAAWQGWCETQSIRHPWGSNQFSEKLRAAVPTITKGRPRKNNPGRLTMLYGIALRPKLKLVSVLDKPMS